MTECVSYLAFAFQPICVYEMSTDLYPEGHKCSVCLLKSQVIVNHLRPWAGTTPAARVYSVTPLRSAETVCKPNDHTWGAVCRKHAWHSRAKLGCFQGIKTQKQNLWFFRFKYHPHTLCFFVFCLYLVNFLHQKMLKFMRNKEHMVRHLINISLHANHGG